jgi:trk system potassium uptake protein TrkA
MGVGRTVAIAHTAEFTELFEAVGVDVAVSPRQATAEEITRFTRARRAENVAILDNDRAEVLEIEVDADSILAGRPIRESMADLPTGVVIGAITRGDDLITPRGDTVVERGDHVVVFADSDSLSEVTEKL